jgi:hypothetical protein
VSGRRAGDHWELAAALIAIEERQQPADKADDEDGDKDNKVADKGQDAGSVEPARAPKPMTRERRGAASNPRARKTRTSKDR